MRPVLLRCEAWKQGVDRHGNVADDAEIELAAAAELGCAYIDLGDRDAAREELLVGEVRAEHQQQIASVHRLVTGGEADESGHADIVRIVVFDMLLAAERMDDGALQRLREFHQLRMRAGTASAAQQRHALCLAEQGGEGFQLRFGRRDDR